MGHLGHGYFWLKLYKERSYKVGQLTIALYQYQDSVLLFCGKDYLSPEFVSIISEKSACITASRLHFSLIYSNYVLSDLLSNNQLKRILKPNLSMKTILPFSL